MTLLREIQDTAVSSETRAADLLRKCKILAARLGSADFGEWVDHELSGYPSKDLLPSYRILRDLQSAGYFSGYGGSAMKNAPIPPSCLPQEWREWAQTEYLMGGVGVYEQLMDKEGSEGTFQMPWPTDLLRAYGQDIYRFMNCLRAWKVIPRGAIVGLLDAIRNRVLGFALEIEKASPSAGEASANTEPIAQGVVSQIFHMQIYGNVGNVASGSHGFSQTAELNVSQGDVEALLTALKQIGVADGDAADLQKAVEEDKKDNAPGIGKRVGTWIGAMISKAASGVWKISLQTATTVLPKLLAQYYGLPS